MSRAGATQLPNFVRRPHGPGWALVGDAGCHKDPFMALGICDALRDAELLAEAIIDSSVGARSPDEAFAGFERGRNESTLPDYHANLAMAQLGPLPDQHMRLRSALRAEHRRDHGRRRLWRCRERPIDSGVRVSTESGGSDPMAREKKPVPGERLTGNAAFEAVTKQVAERNEAAFKAARKLREVADAKMFAERRKRDLA